MKALSSPPRLGRLFRRRPDTGPVQPASWKNSLLQLLRWLAIIYVAALLVLLALEDRLLFVPGGPDPFVAVPDARPQEVSLTSADGNRLDAWWVAPEGWRPEDGAFLFCHGNGGCLHHRQAIASAWHRQRRLGVLLFDYPGYGRSSGSPSEAGCYRAADAAYDWLTHERRVPPGRLIVAGGSLGGAVAVDLAVRRPCRALFLVAAFSSFPDMAQKVLPWMPVRWLVHNQFRSIEKVPNVHVPIFLTHDRGDALIPFAQAERLYAAIAGARYLFATEGRPHHDLPAPEAYLAFERFLAECEQQPSGSAAP